MLLSTLIDAARGLCGAAMQFLSVYGQPQAKGAVTVHSGEDDTDRTALEAAVYLLFERKLTEFIICTEATLQSCFGPLRRFARCSDLGQMNT